MPDFTWRRRTGRKRPAAAFDENDLLDLAVPLLKAAILNRDVLSSMHPTVMAAMPLDISLRLLATEYQDAIDGLPPDVRAKAEALAMQDSQIIAARKMNAERGRL